MVKRRREYTSFRIQWHRWRPFSAYLQYNDINVFEIYCILPFHVRGPFSANPHGGPLNPTLLSSIP